MNSASSSLCATHNLAPCHSKFAGEFGIGKTHLAQGRQGSGSQAYFSTFEGLFGASLTREQ